MRWLFTCVVTFDWEDNDAKEKVKQFRKKGSPSWAVIEVTKNCNLNCKWCYANSGNINNSENHMTIERLGKLLKILKDSGVRQITYSGGEPTLYPFIKKAIRMANENDFVVHMNTNGFILDKPMAKEFRSLGLSQIQTNIDSVEPEKHDFLRGRKGSFEKSIRALRNAKEAGITCVSQTVVTSKNEGEIVEIFSLARSMGIQRCRVWDMMPSEGAALENDNLRPSNYVEILEKLTRFAERTGGKHIESGEPFFPWKGFETSLKISHVPCVAAHGVLVNFSYEGDVYYCVTQRKPMFNVFRDLDEPFDVFYAKELEKIATGGKLIQKCSDCDTLNSCKGGCKTRREYSENKIDYWCTS